MRIVYLHQYFTTPERGGGLRSYQFARRWAAQGHEVHVLCLAPEGEGRAGRWGHEALNGFIVHSLGMDYSNRMGFYRRLAAFAGYAAAATKLAGSLKADVLYATSTPLTVAIPAMARAARGTPYVFEVRDLWPDVPIAMGYLDNALIRSAAIALEAQAYRRASHVVALAPGMKEAIAAKGIDFRKVTVIPQGCDTEVMSLGDSSRVRDQYPWLTSGPVVLYAGAVGPANNLGYLVELASVMHARDLDVQFVVLGDGKDLGKVRSLAQERGILDVAIHFLGYRGKGEVADWLAVSDVTLALFTGPQILWRDSVQNKFFDSLAAERPIATNNDGWQTQIARDEGVGVTLDPHDIEKAARQLLEMLADDEFRSAVPANCQRLAAGRFNRDAQAAQALEILTAVVDVRAKERRR